MKARLRDVPFGQTVSQRIENRPDFLDFILLSDEANFHEQTECALLGLASAS